MRIAHWLLALAVTGSASAPARDPQTVGHDAKQQFRAAIARWTEAAAGMGILLVLTMSVLGGC